MSSRRDIVSTAAVLVTLALVGCASSGNPWGRHDHTADLKTASADPTRMCDVVVENATEMHLDAAVQIEGQEYSLGLLPPGQHSQFGVSCHAGRIEAYAASSMGALGGPASTFRKVARLDVLKATHLRFTQSDRVAENH